MIGAPGMAGWVALRRESEDLSSGACARRPRPAQRRHYSRKTGAAAAARHAATAARISGCGCSTSEAPPLTAEIYGSAGVPVRVSSS